MCGCWCHVVTKDITGVLVASGDMVLEENGGMVTT